MSAIHHGEGVHGARVADDVIRRAFSPRDNVDLIDELAVRAASALQIAHRELDGMADLGSRGNWRTPGEASRGRPWASWLASAAVGSVSRTNTNGRKNRNGLVLRLRLPGIV